MKKLYVGLLFTILIHLQCLFGQSNLLENGGFEADWPNNFYPHSNQTLFTECPYPWLDYNPQDNERWFTDSLYVPTQNSINPNFQYGFYKDDYTNIGFPWEAGTSTNPNYLQSAYEGKCYVGVDLFSDLFTREGIQTKVISDCPLNSGDYTVSLYWSRAYPYYTTTFQLALSDQASDRRRLIGSSTVGNGDFVAGEWNFFSNTFTLDQTNQTDMGNRWFSISGGTGISSNRRHYMYFDDVRLYRQCDIYNRCYTGHGQLCPEVFTPTAPYSLLRARNIDNATKVEVWLYNSGGQEVYHRVHENRNGMPEYSLSRLHLPATMATAFYDYKMQISNDCGGREFTGMIHVQDTALYNLYPVWEDTAANWTQAPIPCCVENLVLQNTQIVGDVDFIVQDQIIVTNGVSVAPGSHVLLQAGHVVELTNVEFDGTNSTVDIVEMPCPNRSSCGNGSFSMVIDNGVVQQAESTPMPEVATNEAEMNPEFRELAESFMAKPEAEKAIELSVFPNPFAQEFTLSYHLNEETKLSIQILDLQMRPVKVLLKDEIQAAGEHELKCELKTLAAGIFFVQFEANGQRIFERIVKQ